MDKKRFIARRTTNGFTLTEMMVVISIILIMGAVSWPILTKIAPHYRLKGASRELIAAFRETQSLSVSTQYNHLIRFSINDSNYSIYRLDNGVENLVEIITLPKNIIFSNITFNPVQIIFTPSGSADNSGTIQMANNNGESININISISGQIKAN